MSGAAAWVSSLAPAWAAVDPVWSPEWVWLRYATALRATLVLALVASAARPLRRAPASARATLWASALLAVLPLPAVRALPLCWSAHVVPAGLATPMVSVGATMVRQSWPGASALPWTSVAGGAWALGVVLVLARLAWAWRARATLARGARPVTDPAWVAALDAAAATIGLRRRVRLLRAPGVGTPMTWGTLRPAVLLPDDARAWPAAHREAVLLHELAHVRRLDCLLAALGHVACAAWWFHPGVWWAARRLGLERERACDERVLAAGVRPSDYAECLLRVAESARHARAAGPALVAAGFVGRSQLRARVHAILRPPAAPRWAPGRLASGRFGPAAAVAGALALALPVGTLRLAPRPDVFWTALRSPDWATRASAAEHLARFGDARTVAALDAALRDERHPAVPAMARFGARLRAPAGGPAPLTLAAPAAR